MVVIKPVRISPIIQDSIKLLRASIPSDVEIKANISCEHDTILGDPTQINQVLINLCTNAAFAMRDKGGVLDISLENISFDETDVKQYEGLTPGDYVRLKKPVKKFASQLSFTGRKTDF
jgi:signal transduction histidine kinase